ncbi:MAG: peptidyl-prolyl cis-trans isomerase [Bradyrhizobium sp.]|uniref:peptidylprolyl isomerase n=1 Tax=Bradyrhizobium sp. TaxID=376 RepID=UPI001DCCE9BE|nr:peptidyl-prolyl cis-trans isomerase [Bradyrhizobium sp.]MBV9563134.1 peptidyl-prolyl cis-trans isomerase [Bradyrhizobium sp.]
MNRNISRAIRILPLCASAVALVVACPSAPAFAQTAPKAPAAQPAAKPKAPQTTGAAQPNAPAAPPSPTAAGKAGDDVVARVGNINVSADEMRGYLTALGPRERAAIGQDPGLLSQAVRLQLANRLVLQELVAKKWDQQPNVAAQLDRLRENALVELYLQTVSVPPANYPSDDEVQQVYDANHNALLMPRQFQLTQIFVPAAKDDKAAEDGAKKALDEIQRKLKAPGADFTAIAIENDSKTGGDLGWLVESQIRPEIRAQVMQLAKGVISEPIRLDDGFHILKLIDTKAAYTRPLAEVRDQLVQQMRSERAAALRRAYLGELLKQHPPVLNEFALSNLLGEQPPAGAK